MGDVGIIMLFFSEELLVRSVVASELCGTETKPRAHRIVYVVVPTSASFCMTLAKLRRL